MFADVAARYDLFNHLFSLNIDRLWRRRTVKRLQHILSRPDAIALDVACGTGDLTVVLAQERARVIGIDFCRPMLALAQQKSDKPLLFIEGDALALPFKDKSFDAVTIAFGLRNLADPRAGLIELRRVIKPDGMLAVLEFSKPIVPGFSQIFNLYFRRVLTKIGDLFNSHQGAYTYLSVSVQKFPDQKQLAEMMREVGFATVEFENLTGGIAALHTGVKTQISNTSV